MEDLPPNIEDIRSRFFTMDEPLTLPLAEFDAAWKYLDNMYNLNNVRRVKEGPIVNRYYLCRLFRKESNTSIIPQKRKRNKPARVPVGCPCRLKAVADERTMTITITRTTDAHNHDYDELGEKLSSGAKELLKREVVKGYSTPYLFKAMKDEKSGAWQLMKAAGGGGLSPKDVMNAVQTYRREHPDARGEVDIQVKDLVTLLLVKYWFVSEIRTKEAHGVVFSHMGGVSGLRRRGCLVLMETVDHMSKLEWQLTTFMVRDEYGTWVPVAFILRDMPDTELMKMALSQIRTWCADEWPLRYIISDGSMGGQDVANTIFEDQDRTVTHYSSVKHSERSIRKHFGRNEPAAAKHLRNAIHECQTEAGCHNAIDAAINSFTTRPNKEYIAREWKSCADQWAMYARQHSALLLQTQSTQRVESWHNRLTEAGALDVPRWSLALIGNRIIEATQQCMAEAKQVYKDFHRKNVEEFDEFPMLQRFPYPVQQIILTEYHKLEDDPPFTAVDDTKTPCSCPFYRKWQLPCVHVLNKERLFGHVFSVAYWETRYSRWEKCGFEVYESMVPDPIPDAAARDREVGTRSDRDIHMREIVNGVMDAYEEFEKGIADEDPLVQSLLLRQWINRLAEHTRPMMERSLQSFIDEAEQDINS